MSEQPWMKFYPRDWRGDHALRVVTLSARGLWIEMLCIMHEASPYGHLLVAGQPVGSDALARSVGAPVDEVQAMLVDLRDAGVYRLTRGGVIYSKRMTDDYKRSIAGRKAKLEAIERAKENRPPSSPPARDPPTHIPEARGKVEGHSGPSTLTEAKNDFLCPKEVREAFRAAPGLGEDWCRSYLDPCGWQDLPDRALIPATRTAGDKLVREGRAVLAKLGLTVLDRAAA